LPCRFLESDFTSAVTILAEIGDFKDFAKAEQLAAWSGLVPSVYQSADKLVTGSITKHGSKHIRWILVEVAQAIARTNKSRLKRFFRRVQVKKGYNVAAVALARKVLCILYHLLMNREIYREDEVTKTKSIDIDLSSLSTKLGFEEMIRVLVKAGYEIRKTNSGTGGLSPNVIDLTMLYMGKSNSALNADELIDDQSVGYTLRLSLILAQIRYATAI